MSPLAYCSFDVVPDAKGASTHILAFVEHLSRHYPVELFTVAPSSQDNQTFQLSKNLHHTQLTTSGHTMIHRVQQFRQQLQRHLKYHPLIHIRSPFEGLPIAQNKQHYTKKLLFEVNGLPSIELKYRYPDVATDRELLDKLTWQENYCLQAADHIITPSSVTAHYLQQQRGVAASKITVIANGVDTTVFTPLPLPADDGTYRLIYFGTLSAWQGVDLVVRALEFLPFVHLHVVGSGNKLQQRAFQHLVNKLHLSERVTQQQNLSQPELAKAIQSVHAVVAPLPINDRNMVQGCCPLKVLEGMAVGRPVISTQIPAVQSLGVDQEHFYLVKPNSIQALIEAIMELRNDPQLAQHLGKAARQHIIEHFTWQHAGEQLLECYRELL